MIDTSPIRDELLRAREHFARLLADCLFFTGQELDHTDEAVGAFCRYCGEETPLPYDGEEDIPMKAYHLKTCEVFKLQARIAAINALLGIKGQS